MSRAIEIGSSFNIIDVERGEKADLIPLSMDRRNAPAFENRIRKTVDLVGIEPFSVWVARPEDVIVGKLMAWHEGRSERHPADIFEMFSSITLASRNQRLRLTTTWAPGRRAGGRGRCALGASCRGGAGAGSAVPRNGLDSSSSLQAHGRSPGRCRHQLSHRPARQRPLATAWSRRRRG